MLSQASVIGFIPVGDFEVAEKFYCGQLGLTVASRGPFALVLTAGDGTMVRCTAAKDFKPQAFTVFGWEVADITAKARVLKAGGVELIRYPYFEQDEDGIWTAPSGDRVAWFNDPFGNVLSISQQAGAAK